MKKVTDMFKASLAVAVLAIAGIAAVPTASEATGDGLNALCWDPCGTYCESSTGKTYKHGAGDSDLDG